MTTVHELDAPLSTELFAEKIFDAIRAAAVVQSLYLGDRLGWYRTLADEGPLTAAELAHRTGTVERYAREWLEQQSVAGLVLADLDRQPVRFALPPSYAAVLADPDSLSYLAPLARIFAATGRRSADLLRVFRTGGGVSWEELGADAREGQAAANRPLFLHQLVAEILPQLPDVDARLREGVRVAEFGCGEGWAAIGLALGYPDSVIDAVDIDEPSIVAARRHAAAHGVSDRVTFSDAGTAALETDGYDAVFAFECIHDLPDPVAALAELRRIAKPGAAVVVMDERTADSFDPGAGPVEELLYGYSVLCCLPDGLSHGTSAATGTVLRPATLDTYAAEAGFAGATPLPVDHDFFRFYRLQ